MWCSQIVGLISKALTAKPDSQNVLDTALSRFSLFHSKNSAVAIPQGNPHKRIPSVLYFMVELLKVEQQKLSIKL